MNLIEISMSLECHVFTFTVSLASVLADRFARARSMSFDRLKSRLDRWRVLSDQSILIAAISCPRRSERVEGLIPKKRLYLLSCTTSSGHCFFGPSGIIVGRG